MSPSNPSTFSLKDEANYHGASINTGFSQDNNINNNVIGGKDSGNVVVPDGGCIRNGNNDQKNVGGPDFAEEVVRHVEGNHAAGPSGHWMFVEWLEGKFCIRCGHRSDQLLVCSENGCPVAVHEACMNFEPIFDDMGKFYCPYCWYKRELAMAKELMNKVMVAKEEFLKFMCLKRDGRNDDKSENEDENKKATGVSTMARKSNSDYCEKKLNDDFYEKIHHNEEEALGVKSISKKKPDEERISKAHGFDNVEDGDRVQEEDVEHFSDSEDNQIDNDRWQIQLYDPSLVETVKDKLYLSTRGIYHDESLLEDNQGKLGKEKPVLQNALGTIMTQKDNDATSEVPLIEDFEFVSPKLKSEMAVMHQKRIKRVAQKVRPLRVGSSKVTCFQPSTGSDKEMKQQRKATTAKESVLFQESTKRIMIPAFAAEKRRRLHWTTEEEHMLKEGVQRFSITVNKNIPWRKILEFGQGVFNPTRTPVDLKDKWKNIMAKETPKSYMEYRLHPEG